MRAIKSGTEAEARDSGGGIRRSLSFGAQRWSSAELSAVSDVRYGGTLARTDDPRWLCVSLLMDARTFDFALASESQAAAWVLGLQRAAALEQRALLEHLEAAPLAEAALELPEEVPVLLHFQWTHEQGW